MNSAKLLKFATLTVILCFGLVGCRKGPKSVTLIPGSQRSTVGNGTGTTPSGPMRPPTEALPPITSADDGSSGRTRLQGNETGLEHPDSRPFDKRNYNQDREALAAQTIYFEFDKSTIQPSERPKIEAVAAELKNQPRAMLEIEGHCDERGTPGYNLSLGERRALAVREYLVGLGIIGERVNTISYGEDQPADPGHNEAAWAKNRRGVFILMLPKQ